MPIESVKDLLIALVKIPSVNQFITGKEGAENGVSAFLNDYCASLGLKTQLLDVPGVSPNLLISKEFKKDAPWILFASHMDTVSSEGMDFDPFCGAEKNGRILGRGSCDDKGSIAASIWALKELGQSSNNIAILLTVDEEQHRSGATAFKELHLPSLAFKPEGVIIAEPTSLEPIVSHAGIGHFSVIVKGKAAHASDPSKGRSAIKDMMKVIETLEEGYINKLTAVDPLCGKAQCSINMISGGRQVNAIPDECIIYVDRRVMPGEDVDGVIPAVEKVLDILRKEAPAIQVSVQSDFKDITLSQDLNDPFITWVLNGLKSAGINASPKGAPFATDAGAFSSAGLPCVVLGPGDDAYAHTANESIGVDELDKGVTIFKDLMAKEFFKQK